MDSQSDFADSVLNEFTDLARPPSSRNNSVIHDGNVNERLNRQKWLAIGSPRLRIAQVEASIANFSATINALEGAIEVEHVRTGIRDPAHFAYSTAASAMIQRRDNLRRSIDELKRQLRVSKSLTTLAQ